MKTAKISNASLNNTITELEYDLEILEIKRELDQILESNERIKEKERIALENEYLVRKMLNQKPPNLVPYKLAEPSVRAEAEDRTAITPTTPTSAVQPHKIFRSVNRNNVRFQDEVQRGEALRGKVAPTFAPQIQPASASNGPHTPQQPAQTTQVSNNHNDEFDDEDLNDLDEIQSEEILFQHEYESTLSGEELKQLKEKREQEAAAKQRERNEAFMQQLQQLRKENETRTAQMIANIRENEQRHQRTIQQQKKEIKDLSAENYQLKYQLKTTIEENRSLTQQNDELVDQLLSHGEDLKKIENLHKVNDELIQHNNELENKIRLLEKALSEKTKSSDNVA